jgi:hypothetical protein
MFDLFDKIPGQSHNGSRIAAVPEATNWWGLVMDARGGNTSRVAFPSQTKSDALKQAMETVDAWRIARRKLWRNGGAR